MMSLDILSLETVVTRIGGVLEAEVDGEVVALDIEKGTCYGLNKVGSRVSPDRGACANWRRMRDPSSEYLVEPPVCESQVLALIEDLRAAGLVAVHTDAGKARSIKQ